MYKGFIQRSMCVLALCFSLTALPNLAWADGGCADAGNTCVVEPVVVTASCGAECVSTGTGAGFGGATTTQVGYGNTSSGQQTISLPPLPAGKNTRTTPACLAEQLALAEVGSLLMAGGNPYIARNNGAYSFTELSSFRGTMAYPAGPYWTKMQRNFIVDDGSVISIHFEWNVSTGQFTYPPHFNNTPTQGCKT